MHDNHWAEELKKESLKEPELKPKSQWLKPLIIYSKGEFRGKILVKKDWIKEITTKPQNMMNGIIKHGMYHHRKEASVQIIM